MRFEDLAKRPISALRFIPLALRRTGSTPRAARFLPCKPHAVHAAASSTLKHWRACVFSAYGQKFNPPARRAFIDARALDLLTKSSQRMTFCEFMRFKPRYFRLCQGFTLLELLVALGLAATVLGIVASFFVNFSRSSTAQNAAAGAQQSARAAIEYIVYELRMAGLDPLKTADAGIEEISATGNKLRFSSDRCNLPIGNPDGCTTPVPDGDVEDMSERVTYIYDPVSHGLRRCLYETAATFGTENSDGSCQPVLDKVVPNPDGVALFTFLDNDDKAITKDSDRSQIRTVILTLTIEEPAGQKKKVARTYSSRVRLRNIGL